MILQVNSIDPKKYTERLNTSRQLEKQARKYKLDLNERRLVNMKVSRFRQQKPVAIGNCCATSNYSRILSKNVVFYLQAYIAAFVFYYCVSTSSSLPLDANESVIIPTLQALDANLKKSPAVNLDKTETDILDVGTDGPITMKLIDAQHIVEGPRLQAVKKRFKKCKLKYRKTYCMNGGICEWIPELKQPRCACKSDWEGDRCGQYKVDFGTREKNTENQAVVIALVVSLFGILGVSLVACVCWRRVKYLRKQRNTVDENTSMVKNEKEDTNYSTN